MSRLDIILSALLCVSILLNVGVFVYARAAVTRLLSVSEELGDLQEMISAFANHVNAVYELESFYGDQTLKALLEHAISLNDQLDTFEYIYSLTEEEKLTDEQSESTEEDTTPA
jgi:hypothetical protein